MWYQRLLSSTNPLKRKKRKINKVRMVCYENFWPYKYIETQKKKMGTDGVISEAVILNKSTTTMVVSEANTM